MNQEYIPSFLVQTCTMIHCSLFEALIFLKEFNVY